VQLRPIIQFYYSGDVTKALLHLFPEIGLGNHLPEGTTKKKKEKKKEKRHKHLINNN
jgi:hypothetical protein